MIAGLIAVSVLGVGGLAVAVLCVWMMGKSYDSMRLSLAREQAVRMKERLSAFRREQYLITLAYSGKPDLAAALANVPPPLEVEEPPEEETFLEGFGYGRTGK